MRTTSIELMSLRYMLDEAKKDLEESHKENERLRGYVTALRDTINNMHSENRELKEELKAVEKDRDQWREFGNVNARLFKDTSQRRDVLDRENRKLIDDNRRLRVKIVGLECKADKHWYDIVINGSRKHAEELKELREYNNLRDQHAKTIEELSLKCGYLEGMNVKLREKIMIDGKNNERLRMDSYWISKKLKAKEGTIKRNYEAIEDLDNENKKLKDKVAALTAWLNAMTEPMPKDRAMFISAPIKMRFGKDTVFCEEPVMLREEAISVIAENLKTYPTFYWSWRFALTDIIQRELEKRIGEDYNFQPKIALNIAEKILEAFKKEEIL